MASLKAVCWKYDDAHSICRPRPGSDSRFLGSGAFISIVKRHHFSSRLQRMSVVAELSLDGGKKRNASLVKGSPEMIRTLLTPADIPAWYDAEHRALSRSGLRVIALAYRFHEEADGKQMPMHERPRGWVESNLKFAGFVSFRCAVRSDTAEVVAKLHASSHSVVMVTGDAMLTAVFVAREIKIVPAECAGVLILAYEDVASGAKGGGGAAVAAVAAADEAGKALVWRNALTDVVVEAYAHGDDISRRAAAGYAICVSGPAIRAAEIVDSEVWRHLSKVVVFARMKPKQKQRLVTVLSDEGNHVLMCGDGANDVGALKQAHVGVALLSGFGQANVKKDGPEAVAAAAAAAALVDGGAAGGDASAGTMVAAKAPTKTRGPRDRIAPLVLKRANAEPRRPCRMTKVLDGLATKATELQALSAEELSIQTTQFKLVANHYLSPQRTSKETVVKAVLRHEKRVKRGFQQQLTFSEKVRLFYVPLHIFVRILLSQFD